MKRMSPVNVKAVEAYIQKNPTATYSDFAKDHQGAVKISDCYYYTIRRRISGSARDGRKKSNTYIRLFLVEAKEATAESKKLLQKFIDAMNITLSSKIEMIEFGNPSQLEIRELKF